MTIRSAADVLGSTWPCRVLLRALLTVTPAPDNLAMPTIAQTPINSPNRSLQTSAQKAGANEGVSKVEPRTTSKIIVAKTMLLNGELVKKTNMKKGCENRKSFGGERLVREKRNG